MTGNFHHKSPAKPELTSGARCIVPQAAVRGLALCFSGSAHLSLHNRGVIRNTCGSNSFTVEVCRVRVWVIYRASTPSEEKREPDPANQRFFVREAKCVYTLQDRRCARPTYLESALARPPNYKQEKKRREDMQKKKNEAKRREQAARKENAVPVPKP